MQFDFCGAMLRNAAICSDCDGFHFAYGYEYLPPHACIQGNVVTYRRGYHANISLRADHRPFLVFEMSHLLHFNAKFWDP